MLLPEALQSSSKVNCDNSSNFSQKKIWTQRLTFAFKELVCSLFYHHDQELGSVKKSAQQQPGFYIVIQIYCRLSIQKGNERLCDFWRGCVRGAATVQYCNENPFFAYCKLPLPYLILGLLEFCHSSPCREIVQIVFAEISPQGFRNSKMHRSPSISTPC